MKKVLVVLALIAMTGIASADIIVDAASEFTAGSNAGWVNAGDLAPNEWGTGWGIPDLRQTVSGGAMYLQTNTASTDPTGGDPYWLPGNVHMESLGYNEAPITAGELLSMSFNVLSNNLAGADTGEIDSVVTQAFVKVLDPAQGWATIDQAYVDLSVGAGSVSLTSTVAGVAQYGFLVIANNDVAGSATHDLAAVIEVVPEPATMALLGLGGLFLRRRKK